MQSLTTNAFKLNFNDTLIYHYNVEFTKTKITQSDDDDDNNKEEAILDLVDERMSDVIKFQRSKLNRQLMEAFVEAHPEIFPGGMQEYCFDSLTSLYSFTSILTSSTKLQLSSIKSSKIMEENCCLSLLIKPDCESPEIYLKDFENKEKGMQVLRFLKVALINSALHNSKKLPYYDEEKFYCYDNTLIVRSGFPSFGKSQKLNVGVVPDVAYVKNEDSSPVLVINTIKDLFYPSMNLFDFCCYHLKMKKTDDLPATKYAQLNTFLDGLICFSKFGENKVTPILLTGFNAARPDTVRIEHEKEEISLTAYYREVYKYFIKRREWPLAVSNCNGKKIYYPLECLTVAAGQKAKMSNLNSSKINLLQKMLNPSNSAKLEEIEAAVASFETSKDNICKRLQLSIEPSPIQINPRLLPSLKMCYKNDKIEPDSDGKWKISHVTKFAEPGVCDNWRAVLLKSSDNTLTFDSFMEFVVMFGTVAEFHGIHIEKAYEESSFYKDKTRLPALCIEGTKEMINKVFENAKTNSMKFLLFAYSESNLKLCTYIKWMERYYDIVTQCIPISNVVEALHYQNPVIGEIISEANIKLGGLNYSIQNNIIDEKTLFIGIHVDMPSESSPSPDDKTNKFATIGICVLDSRKSCIKNSGNFFVQSLEHDKIETVLENMMSEVFESFVKDKKSWFQRVFVYRGGSGSENEFGSLLAETIAIRKSIFEISLNIPFTYITSTIKNKLQFFNADVNLDNRDEQIPIGTVIDSLVTYPAFSEFYLQYSLNAILNFQPTKFSIIYSDETYSILRMLEKWTFAFCFNHQIGTTSPLDGPSPLIIAEKYAKRGRELLQICLENGKTFDFSQNVTSRSSNLNYSNKSNLRGKNIVS